jgi:two-component system, cell cycle response regulator
MTCALIVEDSPENRDLMSYLLRAQGYETRTARDGEEGFAAAARGEPLDLIVCDINLPKADGYSIASRLKSDPTLRHIPLIAVTALAMAGDKERMLASGFDGYIAKPIVAREFVKQLECFVAQVHASTAALANVTATRPGITPQREPARERVLVVGDGLLSEVDKCVKAAR